MRIDFQKEGHIYCVDGELASISVTELLQQQGIAPDYSMVKESVMENAAEIGTRIHEDLANVLTVVGYAPTTIAGENFQKWVKENGFIGAPEQPIAIKLNSVVIVAGTADLFGFDRDNTPIFADHKTTSKIDREYVSWQVSILDYMFRNNKEPINGRRITWKASDKKRYLCFHFDKKTGDMKVVELQPIPDEEIEELFKCYLEGRIYQRKGLVLADEMRMQVEELEHEMGLAEDYYKAVKARVEDMRKKLIEEMERQNIISYETDEFKITYVPAYDRTSVDSAKLKKLYPNAYSDCQKNSKVKSSVRVTRKCENE